MPVPSELTREDEELQGKVLEAAHALYEKQGGSPVQARVHCNSNARINAKNLINITERLADLIRENPPAGIASRDLGYGSSPNYADLPIWGITVAWASSWDIANWGDGRMREVFPPQINRFEDIATATKSKTGDRKKKAQRPSQTLQERIHEEDQKINAYKNSYDGVWLVLLLGTHGASTWSYVPEWLLRESFDTRYDRVFLLQCDGDKLFELLLQPTRPF